MPSERRINSKVITKVEHSTFYYKAVYCGNTNVMHAAESTRSQIKSRAIINYSVHMADK